MIKEGRVSGFRIWSRKIWYLGTGYDQRRQDIWVQNMIKKGYLGSEYDQRRHDIWVQDMIKEGRISESEYDQGRKDTWVQNMIKEVYLGSEYYQGRKDIWVQDMIKEERISGLAYDQERISRSRIWSKKEEYTGSWYDQERKEGYLGSEDDQAAKNILIRDKIKDGSIFVNFNYKNIILITNTLKIFINIIRFHLTYYWIDFGCMHL